MLLSRRISTISPSPTLALNAKAKDLADRGTAVINFTVGEPDFPTPGLVVDTAIASLRAGRTKYGPAGGSLDLRQAVVDKLRRDNQLEYKASQVVVGMGVKEILFHFFLATLNDGDEVLLLAPYWVSYRDQVQAAGAKAVIVNLADSLKSGKLDIAAIDRHASAQTVGIIINSPNNPAGYIFGRGALTELGAYLKDRKWWVVSDEIYEYMAYDQPHLSILNVAPALRERCFLVNGLSKGFAMTGWRVGYGVGPQVWVDCLRSLQSHSSTCIPGFIDDAAVVALRHGKDLLRPQFSELQARRDLAVQYAKTMAGVDHFYPEGAFYLYLDLRQRLSESSISGLTTVAFADRLLADRHVATVPGEAFGTPGFLRLSFATSAEKLRAGMQKIKEALDELAK